MVPKGKILTLFIIIEGNYKELPQDVWGPDLSF